jgi:hypothetical protein
VRGGGWLVREAFLTRWRAFTIEDPRAAFEQVGGGWVWQAV